MASDLPGEQPVFAVFTPALMLWMINLIRFSDDDQTPNVPASFTFPHTSADNRFVHQIVSFNREKVASSDPLIGALSSAALYGRGLFTTIAIFEQEPFLWDKHWKRLTKDAVRLGIDLRDEAPALSALRELIAANEVDHGRARITFFDTGASELWPYPATHETALLITTADRRAAPDEMSLTTSPYRINSHSPLAGIKSCNYLERVLALDESRNRGFHEAVQLNERGHIVSACMANIFWIKDGSCHTPSLETGCIPGTTREYILERVACLEVEAGVDQLDQADAIFLSSVGLGVARIHRFEGRQMNSIPDEISELFPGPKNTRNRSE